MKPLNYLVCFFVFASLLLSCKNDPEKASVTKESSIVSLQMDSLQAVLLQIQKENPLVGYGVAIVNADSVVYQNGFGFSNLETEAPYTTKTVQPLASISKTFIGVSLMLLLDEGKLNLDEPINSILPYEIVNPYFPNDTITVRHLVTHTSTITDNFDDTDGSIYWFLEDVDLMDFSSSFELVDRIGYFTLGEPIDLDEYITRVCLPNGKWYDEENFLNKPPGSTFEYSNMGATLAARIVEIKSGKSFDQFTKEKIFNPLLMNHTGWFYEDVDAALAANLYELDSLDQPLRFPRYRDAGYPEGQLKSNVEDMTKYLQEMIRGYNGEGELLSVEAYKTLFTPQLDESHFEERSDYEFDDEYNFGVFWAISAADLRLHNGVMDGVYSFLYLNPENNVAVIAFCNTPDNSFGTIRRKLRAFEKEKIK